MYKTHKNLYLDLVSVMNTQEDLALNSPYLKAMEDYSDIEALNYSNDSFTLDL
jgi:hypothetical protein